jgi:aminodeoxyfutalosine synthase
MTSTATLDPPTTRIQRIAAQTHAGERISFDDGVYLDREANVLELGRLANIVRERKNGNVAWYNTNVHLNPTNVCVYRCTFCAFRSDLRAEKSYAFTDDMIR